MDASRGSAAGLTSVAARRPSPGIASETLAERFIVGFRLPYMAGAFLAGFVLFGFGSSLLFAYADPETRSRAFTVALTPASFLLYSLVTYAFWVPRYMRETVARAGSSLSRLHPEGEDGFRRAFAPVSKVRPQVLTWLAFLAILLFALSVPAIVGTGDSPIQVGGSGELDFLDAVASIVSLVTFAVITLALSAVVWTYWSVSQGIGRFGASDLRLRPYYEDRFLGLRPLGTLALALAAAYFAFIGLFLASLLASTSPLTIGDILGMGGLLAGLVSLGLALFFLPLQSLHRRMLDESARERKRMGDLLAASFDMGSRTGAAGDPAHVMKLEFMDRKVTEMSAWPFDLKILGTLSVIVVTVTAALLTQLVSLALGL